MCREDQKALANILPEGDPNRFEKVMGFDLTRHEQGFARFQVELGPQHMNRQGRPHGGVISALIDAAGMYAGNMDADGAPLRAVTISMSCNFIGAPKGSVLICEGRVMKSGRSTYFADARLTDGEGGPLLASGQGAYKYLR